MVLITSRRYLSDLPAGVLVSLDTLPADEAAQMFLRLTPHEHGEPAEVAELVAMCGHLPLAISLLARVGANRSWSIADLIGETRAKLLTVSAESRTVAAAFDLSYTLLTGSQQRFFRHLGLHPGLGITPEAAAALTGSSLADATTNLDQLYADRLLTEPSLHRYRMHDLIRDYAQQLAAGDPPGEREQAIRQLLDYYLHTAFAAERRINPGRDPIVLAAAQPGIMIQQFSSDTEAWDWFTAEHGNLLAVIDNAVRQGLDAHAWQLPWTMATFLDRRGPGRHFGGRRVRPRHRLGPRPRHRRGDPAPDRRSVLLARTAAVRPGRRHHARGPRPASERAGPGRRVRGAPARRIPAEEPGRGRCCS